MSSTDGRSWQEQLPDAVVVVDDRGVIIRASDRVEGLLGWPPDELVGRSIEVLVPERFSKHADDRQRFQAAPVERGMGSGLDLVALHRSGREIPVDIALRTQTVGLATYVVASVRDASAQRQNLILKSRALDEAANGIVITDVSGSIQWVNPAVTKMTGYAAEELIGQNPRILKSGLQDGSVYLDMWATILAGRTWRGSLVNRRKDGTDYYEEQTISAVHGPEGDISNFVAIKQDVTAQVEAQKALREARDEIARQVESLSDMDDLKTTLLHALSHDLNGLLTTIMGSVATLEVGLGRMPEEDIRALIGSLDRGSRRMMSLLNDLVDLDRLDRGIVEPRREETDLAQLVRSCVEHFENDRSRIEEEDLEEAIVLVDAAQIERIVDNLLGNALKYSPVDSPVWVSVKREADGARLVVSDDGPGVPEELREAVFQTYRRGHAETASGLGIGLSLVRRFAELNGGQAWVEDHEGGGASFVVSLPSA